ncbi:HupE/UreJ family protein [Microbulbifer variabilis]|uniref:HupE/UreJ family protein n=1 Tax=Microbulbifer variabilis TaxID=266805 RepID=UPI001CFD79E0|nr:HupE/UreJ family protein [Microbulbifer variabilis]
MKWYLPVLIVILGLSTTAPRLTHAHAFDPAIVEIEVIDDGSTFIRLLMSPTTPADAVLNVELPKHCIQVSKIDRRITTERRIHSWNVDCGQQGVFGHKISVSGSKGRTTGVIISVHGYGLEPFTAVLPSPQSSIRLPSEPSAKGHLFNTAVIYLQLGVEHILLGVDHLLFVLGLLLLVRGTGRLIATITAFTFGHSLTLGLAVLGLLELRSAPVEAAIALSIVFLAREVLREPNSLSLARQQPWLIAAGFGLLHGVGFAGALSEVGVPGDAIPLSLAAFNVGVELGQLIFVIAVLYSRHIWRRWSFISNGLWRKVPAYSMGILGGYWALERIANVTGVGSVT